MTRAAKLLCATLVMVLAIAAPSWASITGLIVIPTADMVGDRAIDLELQSGGSLARPFSTLQFVNTEFGVGDRIETGIDYGFSQPTGRGVLGNAKYVFAVDHRNHTAWAAGVFDTRFIAGSVPFVVVTRRPRSLGFTFGGARISGRGRWFAGIDAELGKRWVLMADYTNGSDNASSCGFNYLFSTHFGVQFGAIFPNSGEDAQYTLNLVYTGSYQRLF